MDASNKILQGELVATALFFNRRLGRLPAQSGIDRQMRSHTPGVLRVGGKNRLTHVVGERIAVGEAARFPELHVRQRVARGAAAEGPLTVGLLIVQRIELL